MRGTSCRSLSDYTIFFLECWSHFLFVFPLPSSSPSMLFSSSPCCHWSCWTPVSWDPSTKSEPIRLKIYYRIKSKHSSMVSKLLLWSQPPSQSSLSIISAFRQATLHSLKHISWDLSSWSWRPITQGFHFPYSRLSIYLFPLKDQESKFISFYQTRFLGRNV